MQIKACVIILRKGMIPSTVEMIVLRETWDEALKVAEGFVRDEYFDPEEDKVNVFDLALPEDKRFDLLDESGIFDRMVREAAQRKSGDPEPPEKSVDFEVTEG